MFIRTEFTQANDDMSDNLNKLSFRYHSKFCKHFVSACSMVITNCWIVGYKLRNKLVYGQLSLESDFENGNCSCTNKSDNIHWKKGSFI